MTSSGSPISEELRSAFESTVEEGEDRVGRSWAGLIATGLVGGIDVSTGLLAQLIVLEATGNELLGALAFGIGFIALALAKSELFTENFLVPIAAVAAGRASVFSLARLWGVTLAMNLLAGWLIMGLVLMALPRLEPAIVELGSMWSDKGIGLASWASGMLGGVTITLMTWMERGTDSVPARLVAVVSAAFLLAAGPLNHAVILSLEMFGALHVGAPFGYVDWLAEMSWTVAANMVGGIGLVTVLRLVQVGKQAIREAGS